MLENYLKRLEEEHNNLSNVAIFNLSEPLRVIGKSSSSFFHDDPKIRIEEFGWPEKLAPSLECLCSLCKSIDHWLNKDRHKNIVILYSRRDLSRAALAIAVFLHYVRICLPDDDYFDFETMFHYFRNHLETYLNQSQKRFINYFKNLLNGDIRINVKKYYLNQIVLKKMPNFNGKGFCRPFIKIYQGFDLIYSSDIYDIDEKFIKIWDFIIFNIEPPLKLRGEILIEFYHHVTSPLSQIKMFSFQFHTGTFNDNRWMFSKDEIDIVAYDRRFDKETSVEFLLNEARISLVQNVRLISELNFTKTNSYENFFIYQSPTKNVYHTKGPLDGSLYATVAKKLIPNHQKPEAIIADNQIEVTQTPQRKTYSRSSPPEANSKKNNEDMLDELLSEIFSEIQSFPDSISMNFNNMISPNVNSVFDEVDSIDSKLETNGDISYIDEEDEVTLIDEQKQFVHGENHQEDSIIVNHQKEFIENKNPQKENSSTLLTTDLDDYDNVESMKWLEKQQAKLRNKRNNKEYIEKRLIAELKNTIKHQNDSDDSDSLPAPEIPPRTSSRNLIKSDLILKNNVDDDNDDNEDIVLFFSKSNDQIDENDDQLSTVSSLMDLSSLSPPNIRSSTPSFPVRRLSPKLSSIPEYDKSSQFNKNTGPLFIKDTSSFWYKPTISREEDPIRHFLIESTNKGVQIKGCVEEPVFSSLSALVYQHSITRISLPTTLLIPSSDLIDNNREDYLKRFYDNGAACNVLYFTCVDVESLSGPMAIKKIIDNLVTHQNRINPTIVHFKASIKGITLTDNSHRFDDRKAFLSMF
ncbi:tensin-like protein [Sarcoptes scabiei]|uniref:Tensin-like protein n=1 Tax=Sarcoptes scabiei TaxID=52283 RepID=A0A131ZUA1_SARSC|nr:tensin-like protein [Sarcoptes scabiei]